MGHHAKAELAIKAFVAGFADQAYPADALSVKIIYHKVDDFATDTLLTILGQDCDILDVGIADAICYGSAHTDDATVFHSYSKAE